MWPIVRFFSRTTSIFAVYNDLNQAARFSMVHFFPEDTNKLTVTVTQQRSMLNLKDLVN